MNRLSNSVLFKLFLVMLAIDAVLFLILAGIVLNALENAIGLTPELVTWIAIYLSAMVIFTIILFVLVIVTVTIRVKDARHYYQVQRSRREMELKRYRQRLPVSEDGRVNNVLNRDSPTRRSSVQLDDH